MTRPEWLLIAVDAVEYWFRRAGCRIFGHRWKAEYEWNGDVAYFDCWFCLRCHETER